MRWQRAATRGKKNALTHTHARTHAHAPATGGRAQEVPSEDAALTASYGAAFVAGLQGIGCGSGASTCLAAATLKHWVGYDLEGYEPRTDPQPRPASSTCDTPGGCQRWNFDARLNDRDLHAYFAAPFLAAIDAGARSVMCAYSAVRGVPACASPLLNEMLRDAKGWDGHVVSDCTAIELMGDAKYDGCEPPFPPLACAPDGFPGHNYVAGVVDTANAALRGGTDVNCGPFYRMWLGALAANGSVAAPLIDDAVARVYTTAAYLGLLDGPRGPFARLNESDVDSAAHRALALRAAAESLVLLKNAADPGGGGAPMLPLRSAPRLRLAFVGPHANATQALLSNCALPFRLPRALRP